jgi:hypothetical protein
VRRALHWNEDRDQAETTDDDGAPPGRRPRQNFFGSRTGT